MENCLLLCYCTRRFLVSMAVLFPEPPQIPISANYCIYGFWVTTYSEPNQIAGCNQKTFEVPSMHPLLSEVLLRPPEDWKSQPSQKPKSQILAFRCPQKFSRGNRNTAHVAFREYRLGQPMGSEAVDLYLRDVGYLFFLSFAENGGIYIFLNKRNSTFQYVCVRK